MLVDRIHMAIGTFVPFLAHSLLNKILARRDFIFLIDMKIFTIASFLALFVQPMYAYCFLFLAFIYFHVR